MNESILIGTYGWESPAWNPQFYPAELPSDWRFCFFSNRIRAAIVPASISANIGPALSAQWVEDSDPAFRLVPDVAPTVMESRDPASAARAFLAALAPADSLIAAFLLPLAASLPLAHLEALLAVLARHHPVCVRAETTTLTGSVREVLQRYRVSVCWLPEQDSAPEPDGRFLITLMHAGDPRALRAVLQKIAAWPGEGAGLFFLPAAEAPQLAEQARTLAEIMGV